MTVILAARQGDNAELVADMMITGDHKLPETHQAVPGRLKLCVMTPNFTVGFAGNADRAQRIVRDAYLRLGKLSVLDVCKQLQLQTEDDEIEFLCAHHDDGGNLYLAAFRRGGALEITDNLAIGEFGAVRGVLNRDRHSPKDLVIDALRAFEDLPKGANIGGVAMGVSLAPNSHRYRGYSSHAFTKMDNWEPNADGDFEEPLENVATGLGRYDFAVRPSPENGVAVCALEFPQAPAAFIYSPLEDPRPIKVEQPPDKSFDENLAAALRTRVAAVKKLGLQ